MGIDISDILQICNNYAIITFNIWVKEYNHDSIHRSNTVL